MHCKTPKDNVSLYMPKKRDQRGAISRIVSKSRRDFAGAGLLLDNARVQHPNVPFVEQTKASKVSLSAINGIIRRGDGPELLPFIDRSRVNLKNWRHQSTLSLFDQCELTKIKCRRRYWRRKAFQASYYTILAVACYLLLVGFPLWEGSLVWLYSTTQKKSLVTGGWAIFIGISTLFSAGPLLIKFESHNTPIHVETKGSNSAVHETALLVPCHNSESVIGKTIKAALRVFPSSHIFAIANGDYLVPSDKTKDICDQHGVNFVWCPVGSKAAALFVGCHAARKFRYVFLIDDDCLIPPDLPIVASRLTGRAKCIGYTITSVDACGSIGSYCQQAQDLEYKLSGLQRTLAGRLGSSMFPHGAVSLWDRRFLKKTFKHHPGFSISEDWFQGNSCRALGGSIEMCSAVFIATSTPSALFRLHHQQRGGFGETTVFQQRFSRWNFLFAIELWSNVKYVLLSWKMGWRDLTTKLFVTNQIFETFLNLAMPFVLPISFWSQPWHCCALSALTIILHLMIVVIFNAYHLRAKGAMIQWRVVFSYYIPFKLFLLLTNAASFYWAIFKYGIYFSHLHPKLPQNHKAVTTIMKLERMEDLKQGIDCSGGYSSPSTQRIPCTTRASGMMDSSNYC
ncbi:hypothetical protein N7466_003141 [Penicillium verhagenii]|uniref:uncharacterized protein n=1 Tax=Penicillium verhagenii TaxID=1562060 RepID=UPI002544F7D7|nr:uncharacterized protein N7466_003141 [Penicillium verhagenii]KAJ5936691.1 hypothetical protein N7466_003141 [Penicillium verhagenii]